MRRTSTFALIALLLGVLAVPFGGCDRPIIIDPPAPTPGPGPGPTPTPQPTPSGHVVTVAEFEGIALGTSEADLVAAFGQPFRKSAIGQPGTSAFLYLSTESLIAEFWILNGRVVNKNRL